MKYAAIKRLRLRLASWLSAPYIGDESYVDVKIARYSIMSALEYGCSVKSKSVAWQKLPEMFSRLDKYDTDIAMAVDDLCQVIDWLREEKLYSQSDRLRTITGRLARARRSYWYEKPHWCVSIARKFK